MRILIIGAGISGLAAALGIVNSGHTVSVCEQSPEPRATGGAVTLWNGGVGILRWFGVDLAGVGARIDQLETRSETGEKLYTIDVAHASRRLGHMSLTCPRRLLQQRITEALPAGTVHYGHRLAAFTHSGSGVRATFEDGTVAEADMLIGADGHRSVVRTSLWGHHPPRLAGWATWQGLSAQRHLLPDPNRGLMINGRLGFCGLLPAGPDTLQWWFSHPWPGADKGPALPTLRTRFGQWADPVPLVLKPLQEADIEVFPHYTHRVPARWGQGAVTLLGDAAHTMPPIVAQGANQAVEDAWALTVALHESRGRNLPEVLRRFERSRARRVAPIARLAATEYTYRYHPPALDRLIPDGLVTRAYAQWLRTTSGFAGSRAVVPADLTLSAARARK